jgi:hypothetical protein
MTSGSMLMWNPWLSLGGLLLMITSLQSCSDSCDGHSNGIMYCNGSRVMQCRDGYGAWASTCSTGECLEVSGEGPTCVIPGLTCPTSNLGYQCMGEQRIDCLANGRVADYGTCSSLTPRQVLDGEGPYCVDNPGGSVLACSWKRETCDVEGEVHCFDDGSAICKSNVYLDFKPNTETGQLVCDVAKVDDCWNGRTWCDGDILKRCDRCLDSSRCLQVSIEAVCNPGACAGYQPPSWLVPAKYNIGDPLPMGCTVDVPECAGKTGMVCKEGSPAICAGPGKSVIALSCAEIQMVMGGGYVSSDGGSAITMYGPYCMAHTGGDDVICAQDTASCETGRSRCDPTDLEGKIIQLCLDGLWLESSSCEESVGGVQTTTCRSTTLSAFCQ